ncbi:LysM peptidoglycan-binding domain-containing protein [Paenibacillus sp. L3-i20]|uniref:LysM peptidoglycan-binding domain-containing protein n=1 Tax=Paenibacillus sp. L3-i20 TaxID=2905833 RepID=UPI001EDF4687|nr:LysM peptidoglycan-binding domain-containing protein [Paenibacillus sp. L3-i20]GKU75655.1 peptidoglycan-binding protein LysM [Paenibacillus sp. L3-i20]
MTDYGIWLSWNNQTEAIKLPVLPPEISVSGSGDGDEHEVYGLGKINVIKSPGLSEYVIDSFLPALGHVGPWVNTSVDYEPKHYIVYEPKHYIDYIQKWRQTLQPIRFIYTGGGLEINTPASIESFEWKEVAGAPGDIMISLKLKEYRFFKAQRVKVVSSNKSTGLIKEEQRANERLTPTTYTLVAGDNLWKVAAKVYGNSNRWPELQKANGISNADLKRLRIGMVLKVPGGKANA